jgi:hypothetical protein
MSDETQDEAENKPANKQTLHPAMEERKWQPGQSGNPGGRPKKKPVTDLYEAILGDEEAMEQLKKAVLKALTKGNMAMVLQLKEMTDRVEGKVTQPIEADVRVDLAGAIAEARKRAGR